VFSRTEALSAAGFDRDRFDIKDQGTSPGGKYLSKLKLHVVPFEAMAKVAILRP
jgi:hypothetical protein